MKRFDRSSDLIDFVASFVQAIFLCTPSLPGATCSSLNAVGWSRCMFLQISTLALCLKRVIFPDRLMRIDWLVDFVATTLLWYFSPETWTLSLRPVEGHRTGFLGQTWLRKLHTGVAVFRRCACNHRSDWNRETRNFVFCLELCRTLRRRSCISSYHLWLVSTVAEQLKLSFFRITRFEIGHYPVP